MIQDPGQQVLLDVAVAEPARGSALLGVLAWRRTRKVRFELALDDAPRVFRRESAGVDGTNGSTAVRRFR